MGAMHLSWSSRRSPYLVSLDAPIEKRAQCADRPAIRATIKCLISPDLITPLYMILVDGWIITTPTRNSSFVHGFMAPPPLLLSVVDKPYRRET